jgi:hypothetical protein
MAASDIKVNGSNLRPVFAGMELVEVTFTDTAAQASGAVTGNIALGQSYKSVRAIASGVRAPSGAYAAASVSAQVVDNATVKVAYAGPAGAKYSVTLECEV